MFKTRLYRVSLISSITLFTVVLSVFAQLEEHEVPQLRKRAIERFEAREYASAATDFSMLMTEFPKDPLFRYYAGICKVEQNKELEEAVELLYYSSSRGVPVDVYYYLGEAYRRMYDFKKAKQYFIEFDKEAPRSLAREKHSKLLIRSAENAMHLTASYNPFEVLNVTFVDLNDERDASQIRMRGGLLVTKPEVLYAENEARDDFNSLMFMPKEVGRGDIVYFSGMTKSGKNGYQIMQAKKGNTGKWVDVKAVEGLNTDLNEILPYFDPVGEDLYFASDGYEGIGGFDLYRSHYDGERKTWSDPINVGFPVNSAFDDYLLLPGNDLGMVMVFSGRQATDTSMVVYRVHLREPKKSLASESPEEIRKIANLNNIASEYLAEIEKYEDMIEGAKLKAKEVVKKEELEPVSTSRGIVDAAYQNLLAEALRHQTVSDSLTELATSARVKVRDSDDPNDRWLYQKQILVWEKKALEEQSSADEIFVEVASYKPQESLPKSIEKDTVIQELTVYKFVEEDRLENRAQKAFSSAPKVLKKEEKETTKSVEEVIEKPIIKEQPKPVIHAEPVKKPEAVKNENLHKINRFEILEHSPYSSRNPIPVDTPLPDGSFYRIQLGVYSKPAASNAFGGLSPITAETMPARNLIKYYVGKFSIYSDAQKILPKVREAGYKDAFIVSWYNGDKMTTEKVIKLEK